jgi:dTDP-4-amino-4,6-dideoxygalactose transaminase
VRLAEWKASPRQRQLIKEVLDSGRLTYGDKTRELEKWFAEIHGAKHALFTSSGTSALKIGLHALKDKYGWMDGSEVIIPSVTFVASMNTVLMNNLKPKIVDVHLDTVNINPDLIEGVIRKKTVAIMPVHLLGQPAEMDKIMRIAKKHNLKLITDSCETMFVNKHIGDITCFSTYIAHLMVTGVGGFILTNDDKLALTMRSLMFHGRDESYLSVDDKSSPWKKYSFPRHGYSDRITELEAAIGLGELQDWQKMIRTRQDNAKYLMEEIGDLLIYPVVDYVTHSFMFLPAYADRRDELLVYLEENGIETRTMMPLISQPITRPFLDDRTYLPAAEYIGKKGILLPCHQYLEKKDLDNLIKKIRKFYA